MARRLSLLPLAALVVALLLAPAAQAKKINVKPGKNTLQKAANKAKKGDTLKLKKKGKYKGDVEIDTKGLTIKGPGKKMPTVDGRCKVAFTILVLAPDVTIKNVKVTGAANSKGGQYGAADVNYIEDGSGKVKGAKLKDSCGAQYGVNAFDILDLKVTDTVMKGYDDAGVYIGGIRNSTATVAVTDSKAKKNNRGILVEDSFGNSGITVADNKSVKNDNGFTPVGIFLFNSDGVVISNNVSNSNAFAGVWLDQNSDDNQVLGNQAADNGETAQAGPGADLVNDGQRNCGSGNVFRTTTGNPLGVC